MNDGSNRGTYIEAIATVVEYRIVSDLVRGEGGVDIQLTVLDKKVLVECSGHFKFVVADRGD